LRVAKWGRVNSTAPSADINPVDLSQCPYDHTPVEADAWSGGSIVLTCPACEAQWEWHGAWLRRLTEPNREKMLAARNRAISTEPAV